VNTYESLLAHAKRGGHTRCCGPIALSLISGESFDVSHHRLTHSGYRKSKRGGVTKKGVERTLNALGWVSTKIEVPTHIKTNRSLAGQLDPSKKYLVQYSNHIAVYVNGILEDWAEGNLKRVVGIVEMTPPE
jgi:hypothetical protein